MIAFAVPFLISLNWMMIMAMMVMLMLIMLMMIMIHDGDNNDDVDDNSKAFSKAFAVPFLIPCLANRPLSSSSAKTSSNGDPRLVYLYI